MPGTGINIFVIDVLIRPFAKILEKMPFLVIFILFVVYGFVAYTVIKSAYLSQNP